MLRRGAAVLGTLIALGACAGGRGPVTPADRSGESYWQPTVDMRIGDTRIGDTRIGDTRPSGNLLEDQFDSGIIDFARWSTGAGGGGSTAIAAGELVVQVPAQTNAYAEVYSKASFPPGHVFEARVFLSAAQFYDHRGIGFSNGRVGAHCGDAAGESEAAQWRAQDQASVAQSMSSGKWDCDALASSYTSRYRVFKIVRKASQLEFYEDGSPMKTITNPAVLSSASLPVRFSAFSYTAGAPSAPITIRVDWVKIYRP